MTKPRVIHLYSDWKWTGAAEPTVQLCAALMARGWDVLLACRRPPEDYPRSIVGKCLEMGVPVTTELHLNRYLHPWETLHDLRRTGALLEGHFLLSSGRHSERYVQCARLLQHPDLAQRAGRLMAEACAPPFPITLPRSSLATVSSSTCAWSPRTSLMRTSSGLSTKAFTISSISGFISISQPSAPFRFIERPH